MKKYIALAALLTIALIAFVAKSDATTTYANGTAGTDNAGKTYTPVVQTDTLETETAPSGSTAGHSLAMTASKFSDVTNVVVTVKAHVIVNVSGDAGIYDMTDATTGYALNTFGPSAKLLMWVLDDANGNTAWTRHPSGDKTLAVGDATATFTVKPGDLPRVKRFALVPYKTNVPTKITYSERSEK